MLALDEIALANTEERIKMFAKREYIHGLSVMAHERNNPLDVSVLQLAVYVYM